MSDIPNGTWPRDSRQRAFVDGARWWQFSANGATAFPAEVDAMEAEAVYRYGEPKPARQSHAAIALGFLLGVALSSMGAHLVGTVDRHIQHETTAGLRECTATLAATTGALRNSTEQMREAHAEIALTQRTLLEAKAYFDALPAECRGARSAE